MLQAYGKTKRNLYTQAIQLAQLPFSARMQLSQQRVAFVQWIDEQHAPIEPQLAEGLARVTRAYQAGQERITAGVVIGGLSTGGLVGALTAGGPISWLGVMVAGRNGYRDMGG